MLQGSANQMMSPLPHMANLNHMNSGPVNSSNVPSTFGNPNTNIQGASNPSGLQNFQLGGPFNRPQAGNLTSIPGLNAYQVQIILHLICANLVTVLC